MKRQHAKSPQPESEGRLAKNMEKSKSKLPRWFLSGLILVNIGMGIYLLAQSPPEETQVANA